MIIQRIKLKAISPLLIPKEMLPLVEEDALI